MSNTNDMSTISARRVQAQLCDKGISTELSNDYTLPDYQPEIRRVLRVGATVLPAAKYISGSNAEQSGTLDYRLLYIASDGKLYSAPLVSEYSLSAPLDISGSIDLNEGVTLLCDTEVESVTTRVSGPRKLSIRSRLNSRLRAYGTMVLDELVSGESAPESIERLEGECQARCVMSGMGEVQQISADINMASSDMRVIDAYCELCIDEVRASEGYADCKGDAVLRLLVCDDTSDGAPREITQKLPFEERIEIDGITSDSECVPRAYVSDISVSVEEGNILCNMSVLCEVIAHKNIPVSYTKDLYSTENYSECAYKDHSIPCSVSCFSSNFSQSERIELDGSRGFADARVISCRCEPSVESCSYDSSKYTISGQNRYIILTEKDGEYSVLEESAPFKYETSTSEPFSQYSARVSQLSSNARIDGSTLALDCELLVSAELSAQEVIRALSEVRFGERMQKDSSDMIICYPTPDDTLWSISKRYAVPAIKLQNVTDPEQKLDSVDYLVVNF